MVNDPLLGERSVAMHATIGFFAIFRKTAKTAAGCQIRDRSNCLKIFRKFEATLNQMRGAIPTRLSNRAARFGVGNKTTWDIRAREIRQTGQKKNVFPYQDGVLAQRGACAGAAVRR
jgi:hypothetical protein